MDSKASSEARALRCWIENGRVWLELTDQRVVSFPAAKYPLLAAANEAELGKVRLRLDGLALRWEELDEDIWVDDAVNGRFPRATAPAASS